MCNLKKKGYFFMFDAFIGSTIIFLSLMLILGGNAKPTTVQYNYEMAEEYSTFIMNSKIRDLNNPYVNNLISDGYINDTGLTVVEQVNLFYYFNDSGHARGIIQNLTESLVEDKYGFSYTLINNDVRTEIYNRSTIPLADARVVISSRKITFLQINSSAMFGPAMMEIKIWN